LESSSEQFRGASLLTTLDPMRAIDPKAIEEAKSARPLAVRVREACRLTGIGRSKLYELIGARELGTFKIGTMTLIATAELERFLAVQAEGIARRRQR
jgi:excisionase family DNA binding protein